jgi:4-hydroxy-3-polyprenylbenzoate decarboxylase
MRPQLSSHTMYRSLREFITALDAAGELLRITETVSPILEITEIADRHSKLAAPVASDHARVFDPTHCELGGKALLFENVEGCAFPLAINIFGSYRRMEMALGCHESGGFASIAARIASLTKPEPPRSIGEAIGKAREILPLLRTTPPKRVRHGPCQEVVRLTSEGEVDLLRIPLIKCWPLDGDPAAVGYDMTAEQAGTALGQGRYITFAGMHTIHPDDEGVAKPSSHNIGMYRAQLVDATHLVMHWHIHHDGAAHWRAWKKRGRPMPIAICFGGESVLPYAATAPLPSGVSELLMAGFLNGRGIRMVRAKTVPLWVPANTEIVIEGYVSTECGPIGWDPSDGEPLGPGAAFEGPFGDHTGYYSMPDRYPLVDVTAVTHRRDAIFPATIVGYPPQEDYYLGKATERIFLPLLKTIIPDIEDYHLPMFGSFHNCAFIRIDKAYAHQARRVMYAVWGAGQMAWTKMIVIVDDDVDVHDEEAVLRAMFERCHFARDIEPATGPLDILDHAAPYLGAGGKIGFDATHTFAGEALGGVGADATPELIGAEACRTRLRALGEHRSITGVHVPEFGHGRCVFIGVDKSRGGESAAATGAVWDAAEWGADFIVAVDPPVNLADWQRVMFHLCANADPGRDLMRRGHRIGFDATSKRDGEERHGRPVRTYPPIIEMDESIRRHVDERAAAFGLS